MSKASDTPITATPNKNSVPQVPEPEMITRNDLPDTTTSKRWNIVGVQPQRGEPATGIDSREMRVPLYDTEHSRTIRAHEMVHAKVSPNGKQFEKWVKRGYASAMMMVRVEELRVNLLAQQAGFDTMTHLSDGSEYLAGQRTAEVGDFRSAVADAVAFRCCAGYDSYIAGIASKKPEWVEYLTNLSETAERYFRGIMSANSHPALHETHTRLPLSGFGYVENVAKWLEEMVGSLTENPTGEPQKEGKPKEGEGEQKEGEGEQKEGEGWKEASERKAQETQGRWHSGSIPKRGRAEQWEELRIGTPALERNVMGAIGRKRVATNMGRNPRRMSRLLTDPDKRIFDRTVKGAGGVVLIDTSGSMSLSHDEVMEMVLSAPSALVAQYSGGRSNRPNLYVVANRGKCVRQLPDPNGGNGMDAPALRWAVSKRQSASAPIIWVSDGGVTGKGDSWQEDLVMECISIVKRNGIYTAETPEQAIAMLKAMARGEKVRSIVPEHLANVYRQQTGHTLTYR